MSNHAMPLMRKEVCREVAEPRGSYGCEEIPLSREAHEIQEYVRRPLHARTGVLYARSFLESYSPNRTFYLSPHHRDRLRSLDLQAGTSLPAGKHQGEHARRLLLDFTWASCCLDGNVYSKSEAKRLIEEGERVTGKPVLDARMLLNHKEVVEFLLTDSEEDRREIGFNAYTTFNLFALLADGLLNSSHELGRIRSGPGKVEGTVYRPLVMSQSIEETLNLLLLKASAIEDPFEQSFFVLVHVPYLQPFCTANEWLSSLLANIPFILHGRCPLLFIDMPVHLYMEGLLGVYELNRTELLRDVLMWIYERSCKSLVRER